MAPWFWTSSTPDTQSSPSPLKDSTSDAPKPTVPSNLNTSETQTSTPESSIDAYLQNLESSTRIKSSKYSRTPGSTSPSSSSEASEPIPPLGKIEDDLLPTDISARAAFDSAFYCQSLGGKFNDLYRYGGIKSCSHHWKEFWFAMKVKSMWEPMRSELIKEYYREKALKYKVSASSEDVWKTREELVNPDDVFSEPFPDEKISNEEWAARREATRKWLEERNRKAGSDYN